MNVAVTITMNNASKFDFLENEDVSPCIVIEKKSLDFDIFCCFIFI